MTDITEIEIKRVKRLEIGGLLGILGIIFGGGIAYKELAVAQEDIAELRQDRKTDQRELQQMRIILERVDANVSNMKEGR